VVLCGGDPDGGGLVAVAEGPMDGGLVAVAEAVGRRRGSGREAVGGAGRGSGRRSTWQWQRGRDAAVGWFLAGESPGQGSPERGGAGERQGFAGGVASRSAASRSRENGDRFVEPQLKLHSNDL